MVIISASLSEKMIQDMDHLKDSLGFATRSEIIRAGIRTLLEQENNDQNLDAISSSILLVVHQNKFDSKVVKIKHDYEDLIKTHLHSKIDDDRCIEMFLLGGDGKRINSITKGFLADRTMDIVKMLTI